MRGLQFPQPFDNLLNRHIDSLAGVGGDDDLSYDEFAAKYLYIQNKDGEIVPFIRNRVQHHFYEARQQSDKRFHLIIKSRQKGISTDIQGEMFYRAVTSAVLGASMANDGDNTAHLRNMSRVFFDGLPGELGVSKTADNASITRYLPTNSSIRIGTAGSKQKGRSGTYTFFHGSEVAFWPDASKTIAGALQGLAPGGTCVFETTANGAQGWVWETVNNPGKWHIHFYAWWWADEYQIQLEPGETIEYTEDELRCIETARKDGFDLAPEQIKWRRDKQKELKELFDQEYPETLETAFITSGGGVFNRSLITFLDDTPEYTPEHVYVAGIDWGQDNDYTATSIGNRTLQREVFLGRWRKQRWSVMRQEMLKQFLRYRVRFIMPEKNSMGSSQIESLWDSVERLVDELSTISKFGKEQWHQLAMPNDVITLGDNGYEIRFDKGGIIAISDVMNWYIRFLVDTYDILSDECIVYHSGFGVWECELKPFTMGHINKHEAITFFRTGLEDYGYGLLDDGVGTRELITYESKRTATNAYSYSAPSGGHDDTIIARILSYIAMMSFE
jgi:hypothetical protein